MRQTKAIDGFTLLELMVTIIIIAILAAIAIPSYERYTVRAAQAQAKSAMLSIIADMEMYVGKNLSLVGFDLTKYQSSDAMNVYIPQNASAANYTYKITLMDKTDPTKAVENGSRSWKMIAQPNPNGSATLKSADRFYIDSSGFKCSTITNIDTTATDCGTTNLTSAW